MIGLNRQEYKLLLDITCDWESIAGDRVTPRQILGDHRVIKEKPALSREIRRKCNELLARIREPHGNPAVSEFLVKCKFEDALCFILSKKT